MNNETTMKELFEEFKKALALSKERLLTVKEVASLLSVSTQTVRNRMDNGELRWVLEKESNKRKIRYSHLMEYINNLPVKRGPITAPISE